MIKQGESIRLGYYLSATAAFNAKAKKGGNKSFGGIWVSDLHLLKVNYPMKIMIPPLSPSNIVINIKSNTRRMKFDAKKEETIQ